MEWIDRLHRAVVFPDGRPQCVGIAFDPFCRTMDLARIAAAVPMNLVEATSVFHLRHPCSRLTF
jgi:hypothetical protein